MDDLFLSELDLLNPLDEFVRVGSSSGIVIPAELPPKLRLLLQLSLGLRGGFMLRDDTKESLILLGFTIDFCVFPK